MTQFCPSEQNLLNPFLLIPYGVEVCLFAFFFRFDFTGGRTPWTSDQLVARPLPKHRTTQTQDKHIYIPNIHALYGIPTHDPGEDSSCLRPLGYRGRLRNKNVSKIHNDCGENGYFYNTLKRAVPVSRKSGQQKRLMKYVYFRNNLVTRLISQLFISQIINSLDY
jgi:hypothetical protein